MGIEDWGFQMKAARKTGIVRSTINQIIHGKRRATAKSAEKLEEFFTKEGIPLNRWDLLYGVRVDKENPQSLVDYLATRKG